MTPEDAVVNALRGRPGAVLAFVGPPGIGKTYAAQALLRRVAVPAPVLSARTPLAEWPLLLPRPRKLPAWAEAALPALPEESALTALAALLAALAPLCLLVEDLHDAAPAQQAALLALAQRVGRARGVALLLTSRQPLPTSVPAVTVQALEPPGTAQLIGRELGGAVPDGADAWIHARALGNPLFTLEYLRYLVRSGHLYSDGQRWHWRVPGSGRVPDRLEALIAQTLGRAGEQRALLEARAVVPDAGREVWALVAGCPPDQLERALPELLSLGLLEGAQAQFPHPLYAEVLQAGLDPARGAALARRALAAHAHDPLRAVAFLEAAQLPVEEALTLLAAATEQAEAAGRLALAGTLLARASDLHQGPQRAETGLRAARHLQGSDLPRALELARRALAEPSLAAPALGIAATLSARIGGRAALDALLADVPPTLPRHNATLTALHGCGDHAGVLALWDSLDAAQQAQADVSAQQCVLLSLLAVGRTGETAARLQQALLGPLNELERLTLGSVQMLLLFHQGHYRQAADLAAVTASGLEDTGNHARASALHHNGAAFLRMLGAFDEALPELRRALDTRRDIGDLRGYASSLGLLGEIEMERGQLDAAEDVLTEALGILTYLDGTHFLLNNLSMLTTLYTHSDAPLSGSLALHHAGRALEVARALGNPRLLVETLADASRAFSRAGQGEAALDLLEEAARLSAAHDSDARSQARLGLARGLALEALGREPEALDALLEAEQLARSTQGNYEADKIAVEVARLRGDRSNLQALSERFEARGQGLGALLARRALGRPDEAADTRLCLLGPLTLDGAPVRGERRRALLLRLLEARLAGRSEVSRLDLTDELYPGHPEPQALGALKQAVAALRADLGNQLVLTTPGGYALGALSSDAEDFLHSSDLSLWRGGLPPEAGETLREALRETLRQAAQAQLEQQPEAAARAGRLLLDEDPLDEAALRLTLQALRRTGNHRSLARLYVSARQEHAALGGQLPERWQEYLAAGATA